eukprot:12085112-Alexandrium_andersonii.AAC.1
MPARRQIPVAALLSAQTSREAENPRSWAMAAQAPPLCRSLYDTGQLGLTGAQSNGLLGRGPMLDGAQPAHAHPPARGPP